MRNEWRQIQSVLNQGCHFVPGFKHLTTVNALDEKPLKIT